MPCSCLYRTVHRSRYRSAGPASRSGSGHRASWTAAIGAKVVPRSLSESTICAPHRVALLPLNRMQKEGRLLVANATSPHSLRSLTHVLGWRFLIVNDQHQPIAAAHALVTDSGDYQLGELNEGPYVTSTFEAFQTKEVRQAMSRKLDGTRLKRPCCWLPRRSTLRDCGYGFSGKTRTSSYRWINATYRLSPRSNPGNFFRPCARQQAQFPATVTRPADHERRHQANGNLR